MRHNEIIFTGLFTHQGHLTVEYVFIIYLSSCKMQYIKCETREFQCYAAAAVSAEYQ